MEGLGQLRESSDLIWKRNYFGQCPKPTGFNKGRTVNKSQGNSFKQYVTTFTVLLVHGMERVR
jgi:hypothetical protein